MQICMEKKLRTPYKQFNKYAKKERKVINYIIELHMFIRKSKL